jgi:hypothetical protein
VGGFFGAGIFVFEGVSPDTTKPARERIRSKGKTNVWPGRAPRRLGKPLGRLPKAARRVRQSNEVRKTAAGSPKCEAKRNQPGASESTFRSVAEKRVPWSHCGGFWNIFARAAALPLCEEGSACQVRDGLCKYIDPDTTSVSLLVTSLGNSEADCAIGGVAALRGGICFSATLRLPSRAKHSTYPISKSAIALVLSGPGRLARTRQFRTRQSPRGSAIVSRERRMFALGRVGWQRRRKLWLREAVKNF